MDALELIDELYAAFNVRDIEHVLGTMHPDIEWPDRQYNEVIHGHDALRRYWLTQWASMDPIIVPRRVTVEGDLVRAEVVETVRSLHGELLYEAVVVHVLHERDGLFDWMTIEQPEGKGADQKHPAPPE